MKSKINNLQFKKYLRAFTQHSTFRRFALLRNNGKLSAGFTFIETVIAIAVLIVSVVAPLSLAAQGLRIARVARDQIVANYLAQEAVEFTRYLRDNDALSNGTWLSPDSFPPECFSEEGVCAVDIVNDTIVPCAGGECSVLQFNNATGEYGYSSEDISWVDTRFNRKVKFAYGSDPEREVAVTVTVSWTDVMVTRSFIVHEKLFNWQ